MDLTATAGRSMPAPWRVAGVAACGCVAVALVDPSERSLTPPCPFRAVTGWWCPFCGATRAAGRLVRGDVAGAFGYHALLVVAAVPLVALWVAWAFPGRAPLLDRALAALRRGRAGVLVGVVAVLVAFTVARNTPLADTWLRHPGP